MTRRMISYSASRSNRDWTTRPYQLDRHSSEYGRTVLRRETVWNLRDAALCFVIMFVITVVATTVSAWLS